MIPLNRLGAAVVRAAGVEVGHQLISPRMTLTAHQAARLVSFSRGGARPYASVNTATGQSISTQRHRRTRQVSSTGARNAGMSCSNRVASTVAVGYHPHRAHCIAAGPVSTTTWSRSSRQPTSTWTPGTLNTASTRAQYVPGTAQHDVGSAMLEVIQKGQPGHSRS